jgi:hypothetical protein
MLELEERVDSLEAMFGRFIINSDNTLRRLENLMIDMRQQAEQDRKRTEQMFADMRQQAEQDRARTDQRFAQMQQQAERDRQQAEQDRRELNPTFRTHLRNKSLDTALLNNQ